MADVKPGRSTEEVNLRRRMLTLTRNIVRQILAQCENERPRGSRTTLKFPSRVAGKLALLHEYAPDEQTLLALLNAALPKELGLCFSVADPTLHYPWGDEWVNLALHPADLDVGNLDEVPDETSPRRRSTRRNSS